MPQTGDLILAGDSGLRMRANYSWSKGASRPISDRLLEQAQQNGTSHWQNRSRVFPETSGLWSTCERGSLGRDLNCQFQRFVLVLGDVQGGTVSCVHL